jgi:hypothetical protein
MGWKYGVCVVEKGEVFLMWKKTVADCGNPNFSIDVEPQQRRKEDVRRGRGTKSEWKGVVSLQAITAGVVGLV